MSTQSIDTQLERAYAALARAARRVRELEADRRADAPPQEQQSQPTAHSDRPARKPARKAVRNG